MSQSDRAALLSNTSKFGPQPVQIAAAYINQRKGKMVADENLDSDNL